MKKICFLNSLNFWGGGEKLHLELAIGFSVRNYEVMILTYPGSPLEREARKKNIEVANIKVNNLSFLNIYKLIKLAKFLRREKVDTLIFSGSHDLKIGSIAAKIAGVKNIVYLRGLAVPIKKRFLNILLFNRVLTHIIANSDETKRNILLHLNGFIDSTKVNTIYHGIDLSANKKQTNPEITNAKGIILGNTGRLTNQKGQKFLIDIALKLKSLKVPFTLFIAGEGELKDSLQKLIQENNLEKDVILLGFVSDIQTFMNSIDIFVLTSIWEGFGFVLVEAMLNSKPIVAFDITSNPEIVTNGESGFLVKYPDIDEFASKIKYLAENEELRLQLGNNGRDEVIKRFNFEDRVSELEHYLLKK